MQNKIEWYQEVLSLDPCSRVFYQLAQLFVEMGELEKAEVTLRKGLKRHPAFLEARLLRIEVLSRLGLMDDAGEEIDAVVSPLTKYPAFWKLWAKNSAEDEKDFAAFLLLVASHLQGHSVSWADVLVEGLSHISDRLLDTAKAPEVSPIPKVAAPVAPAFDEPQVAADPQETARREIAGSLRTRTMADILAAQNDFQGALDIYEELLVQAGDENERTQLKARIEIARTGLESLDIVPATRAEAPDVFSRHSRNRLIGTLETLASRFEARVQAGVE
ncbi:MAG: tetratricopeptide repeat protein [Desulfovibrio sp.]